MVVLQPGRTYQTTPFGGRGGGSAEGRGNGVGAGIAGGPSQTGTFLQLLSSFPCVPVRFRRALVVPCRLHTDQAWFWAGGTWEAHAGGRGTRFVGVDVRGLLAAHPILARA